MIKLVMRGLVSSTNAEIRAPVPMRAVTSVAAVECSSIVEVFMKRDCLRFPLCLGGISVPLWCSFRDPIHHRDTENSLRHRTLFLNQPHAVTNKLTSDGRCSRRKTLNTLKLSRIVAAKTSAPQATWATVTAIIGFSGCGPKGDLARVAYAAIPSINCTNNKANATMAGRVRNLSSRYRNKTAEAVTPSASVTRIAPVMWATSKPVGKRRSQVAE